MAPLTFANQTALAQETLRVAGPPPKMETIPSVTRIIRDGKTLWVAQCPGTISSLEILWDDQSNNVGRWRIKVSHINVFPLDFSVRSFCRGSMFKTTQCNCPRRVHARFVTPRLTADKIAHIRHFRETLTTDEPYAIRRSKRIQRILDNRSHISSSSQGRLPLREESETETENLWRRGWFFPPSGTVIFYTEIDD